MDLKKIVGHEDIIRHFKSSIEADKVSHAYILAGEVGIGKKLLATIFAQTLQCEKSETEPCNVCQSCKQADSGNHPDIINVKGTAFSPLGVDDIREQVNKSIGIKPYKSKYKIYIIEEAQNMNVQAQNALLKTIEEPPEYGIVILLTTNIEKLLPTIVSRCIVLNIKPVRERDMIDYLTKELGLTEKKAYFCLDFAQGNLGKAIRLATCEEYSQIIRAVVDLMTRIYDMDIYDIMEVIQKMTQFKLSLNDYLDLMMMWFRDVLMLKITGNIDKLMFKEEYSVLKKQASVISYAGIEDNIKAIRIAKDRINANAKFENIMKLMLLVIKEN